jgi:hypothetical protein
VFDLGHLEKRNANQVGPNTLLNGSCDSRDGGAQCCFVFDLECAWVTANFVDNEVDSGTRPACESQAIHALRHQYIAELLGWGEIFTETFLSDSSQAPWERTMCQIEHSLEGEANCKYDAWVLVDVDEGGAAQPLLSARHLVRGNGIGLGQVNGSGAWRCKATAVSCGSSAVKDCLRIHEAKANTSEVNATERLPLIGPSRNQVAFAPA